VQAYASTIQTADMPRWTSSLARETGVSHFGPNEDAAVGIYLQHKRPDPSPEAMLLLLAMDDATRRKP
jgi:hypothetical protein